MNFDGSLFLSALGLALMFEAAMYALFPDKMKEMMRQMLELPSATIRRYAFGGLSVGLVLLCLARG